MTHYLKLFLLLSGLFVGGLEACTDETQQSMTEHSDAIECVYLGPGEISARVAIEKASCQFMHNGRQLFLMELSNKIPNLLYAHVMNLAQMLSNPDTMKYYLSGQHYPRDKEFDVFLYLESIYIGEYSGDRMLFADVGLFNFVLSHFSAATIERYLEICRSCEDCIILPDSEILKYIKDRCEAAGYDLPKQIATHLSLDLRNDGLPRYILGIQEGVLCKVIGLMRFGAYPKQCILRDLFHSPMLNANVAGNLIPDGSYAILGMMIHDQYTQKGYGSAFLKYFMENILPYDIASYPYPEGPLSGFYITMHQNNPAYKKLTEQASAFNSSVVGELIVYGVRENDQKVVMLWQLNPSSALSKPTTSDEDILLEDLEESE